MHINSRLAPFLFAIFSVFIVMVLYYNQNSFLGSLESKSYDLRLSNFRGPLPPAPNIAIVAIDDNSIEELGRFPWSRIQYVRLINKLSAAGAKALIIDALFSERETQEIDSAFSNAIKKAGNVDLAVFFDFDKALQVRSSTHTIPEIERVAAGIGHINLFAEDDGVNRHNKLVIDAEGKHIPSLGMLGAMAALGENKFILSPGSIRLGDRNIPVDANYSMLINYTGDAGNYPRFSFVDIVNGKISPDKLRDKVLFLGATAHGVYDMRATPFDNNVPGVELHATVADNIISGRFMRHTWLDSLFDLAMIVVLGLVAFYMTMHLRLYFVIPAALLLSMGYAWLSYMIFLQGHWVSMIYPPLAVFVTLSVAITFRYLVLEHRAMQMRTLVSSYLSPKLVTRLEKEPGLMQGVGNTKEVTVLFTDIKDFAIFSASRTPMEIVARLNEYYGAVVHVIDRFDGTVDKFIGDRIMFYWGAPFAQPNHAELAISCIMELNKEMERLNAKWKSEGVESFSIRVGAQSGDVVAGNVGLLGKKMEYTLIGNAVNQAARLEGAAKYYGVDVLVGENTYLLTRDIFRFRELDKTRAIGNEPPVTIYELIGTLSDSDDKFIVKFEEALKLYRERRWEEAEICFASILDCKPEDRPSKIYFERCEHYKKYPPPDEWDSVIYRAEK